MEDKLQLHRKSFQELATPEGNQHLLVQDAQGQYIQDDFRHELALHTDGFLFTGCAHSGLENILAACPYPVNSVVGGCQGNHAGIGQYAPMD